MSVCISISGIYTQGFLNLCLFFNARFLTDSNNYKKKMGDFSKMSERIPMD